METKIITYNENPISFVVEKNNGMMVNATEMAKAFGKNVGHFLENDSTKKFIEACLNNRNFDYLLVKSEADLIVARQKAGTYMHRVLALKFAAWLNPDFEIWVYSTIEQILFGKHAQREESLERSLNYQTESKKLRDKPNKTGADFERYLELDKELKREKAIRKSLTSDVVTGMKSLFEEEE